MGIPGRIRPPGRTVRTRFPSRRLRVRDPSSASLRPALGLGSRLLSGDPWRLRGTASPCRPRVRRPEAESATRPGSAGPGVAHRRRGGHARWRGATRRRSASRSACPTPLERKKVLVPGYADTRFNTRNASDERRRGASRCAGLRPYHGTQPARTPAASSLVIEVKGGDRFVGRAVAGSSSPCAAASRARAAERSAGSIRPRADVGPPSPSQRGRSPPPLVGATYLTGSSPAARRPGRCTVRSGRRRFRRWSAGTASRRQPSPRAQARPRPRGPGSCASRLNLPYRGAGWEQPDPRNPNLHWNGSPRRPTRCTCRGGLRFSNKSACAGAPPKGGVEAPVMTVLLNFLGTVPSG
jgi:hypothetical protein